jgi:hypothetical protein
MTPADCFSGAASAEEHAARRAAAVDAARRETEMFFSIVFSFP